MHIGNTVNPMVGMLSQAVQQVQNGNVTSEANETAAKEAGESKQIQVQEGEAVAKSGRLDFFA